ncbi:MAG: hypothetical protein AB1649_27545 [Chloroflexota bacterium]
MPHGVHNGKMLPEMLKPIVRIAEGMLKEKKAAFARLSMEKLQPETKIKATNVKYPRPMMHSLRTMQATPANWIKRQYDLAYKPAAGVNFFPHGMRDPHNKEKLFLFYLQERSPFYAPFY